MLSATDISLSVNTPRSLALTPRHCAAQSGNDDRSHSSSVLNCAFLVPIHKYCALVGLSQSQFDDIQAYASIMVFGTNVRDIH